MAPATLSDKDWTLLQVNVGCDLRQHLEFVIAWLDSTRTTVAVPLIETFGSAVKDERITPHQAISGDPRGLIVQTWGRTTKDRRIFDSGETRGWQHRLDTMSHGKLAELTLQLLALDATGRVSSKSEGSATIGVTMQDQTDGAQREPESSGQLYVYGTRQLFSRLDGRDLIGSLISLGRLAVDQLPRASGFLEEARPWSRIVTRREPVSKPAWMQTSLDIV